MHIVFSAEFTTPAHNENHQYEFTYWHTCDSNVLLAPLHYDRPLYWLQHPKCDRAITSHLHPLMVHQMFHVPPTNESLGGWGLKIRMANAVIIMTHPVIGEVKTTVVSTAWLKWGGAYIFCLQQYMAVHSAETLDKCHLQEDPQG
jgi:hypothetical protein